MKTLKDTVSPELYKMITEDNAKAIEKLERIEAIRQRILKQERIKMNIYEGYILDAYYILTASPKALLKKYHRTDEYDQNYNLKNKQVT
jgi:hypothetical protein